MKASLNRLAERASAEGLLDVAYTTTDSPFGTLLLAKTPRGLVRVGLPNQDADELLVDLARAGLPPRPRGPGRARRDPARARPLLRGQARPLRPAARLAAQRGLPAPGAAGDRPHPLRPDPQLHADGDQRRQRACGPAARSARRRVADEGGAAAARRRAAYPKGLPAWSDSRTMRWRHTAAGESARAVRLAWLASFSGLILAIRRIGTPATFATRQRKGKKRIRSRRMRRGRRRSLRRRGRRPERPPRVGGGAPRGRCFPYPFRKRFAWSSATQPSPHHGPRGLRGYGRRGSLFRQGKKEGGGGLSPQGERRSEKQRGKGTPVRRTSQSNSAQSPNQFPAFSTRNGTSRQAVPPGRAWGELEASFRR